MDNLTPEQKKEIDRQKTIARSAKWYRENHERAIENNRLWRAKNPEKYIANYKRANEKKYGKTKEIIDATPVIKLTISKAEIKSVLNKNLKSYLWDKDFTKWTENDLQVFNQLKQAK